MTGGLSLFRLRFAIGFTPWSSLGHNESLGRDLDRGEAEDDAASDDGSEIATRSAVIKSVVVFGLGSGTPPHCFLVFLDPKEPVTVNFSV